MSIHKLVAISGAVSFFPLYVVILIVSVFDGGIEHTPSYIPVALDSGIVAGHSPMPNQKLIGAE